MAHVALVYNLIRPELLSSGPLDAIAELDSEATICAVADAIREGGHEVVRVEADANIAAALAAAGVDVVFNIAERVSGVADGDSRESLVPALCEVLGLPYTGSSVLTTSLCLDKPLTKLVLASAGIDTPRFCVVVAADDPVDARLRYPRIVKLAREGSSMGLTPDSVVDGDVTMRARISSLIDTYHRPVMIEEFIDGREFTVGVLGNDPLTVLPIAEVVFDAPRGINLFELDDPVRAMAQAAGRDVPDPVGRHQSICPAVIDDALAQRIRDVVQRAYRALNCRDWCRIDLRMAADGTLHVLELNPIAGIDPEYLLPRAAAAAGISYAGLIGRILEGAIEPSGLSRP